MDSENGVPIVRMGSQEKLTLEDYIDFIDSHRQNFLTVNRINQIIAMHGFKRINKTPKNIVIDVLNAMELMNPSRSTLQSDDVSSCAFMTLDEVITDLVDLRWQECCTTSLQTLNSVNYDESNLPTANSSVSKTKPKRPRNKVPDLSGNVTVDAGSVDGDSQSACSPAVSKGKGRRERKSRCISSEAVFGAKADEFDSY